MNNKPYLTLKGDYFFSEDALVYVNRAAEDFDVPMHNHDFVEFAYISEGTGFHHVGDRVHPVRKGLLSCIPIGVTHVFRPSSADRSKHPLTVYNCVLPPRLLERLAASVSDAGVSEFLSSLSRGEHSYFFLHDSDDFFEKLILSMHREYSLPKEAFRDYLEALLLQFVISVMRRKETSSDANPSLHVPPAANRFRHFDELLSYMERHLSEELTLARLSAVSQWSERHLRRLFLGRTEQSFQRYLQTIRVHKSCELLRTTSHKIGAIAEMVGYRDVPSFLAVFKRTLGVTPSAYRKTHVRA